MTTHDQPLTSSEEEEIKLAILDDDPVVRQAVVERLWNALNEKLMASLAHYHFGLSPEDHADIAYDSVVEYCRLFTEKMGWEDKPIYPVVARIALFAGKDKYKKFAKQCDREVDMLSDDIAKELAKTECGQAWAATQASTRSKVAQVIRHVAASMPKRRRQIANAFAQTWDKGHTAKEARDFIFKQTGEWLTHDQYKRGWAEVRKTLQEPIDRLLKEEGYARE
jgi:hypothetical protein